MFYGQDFTIQTIATKTVFCVFFLVLLNIHSLAAIADVTFDILKFSNDSEAFWSFFYIWFGFLCAQLSSELRDNGVVKN